MGLPGFQNTAGAPRVRTGGDAARIAAGRRVSWPSVRSAFCLSFLLALLGNFRPLYAQSSEASRSDLANDAFTSLVVEPERVVLGGRSRRQLLLVTAVDSRGREVDVSRRAELQVADPSLAVLEGTSLVGVSDGTTRLTVRLGTLETRVDVVVQDVATYPPVHFGNDVVPLFAKLGCNSGGCHGKASGQNGFKLSVFGFDTASDYNALVKEARGRRIFPASPEQSLLLLKATAQVPHGGGRRLARNSDDYELLLAWIRQGMPMGPDDAPQLASLVVSPAERILGFEAEQQILARAVYSDGSVRDVTAAAHYASNAEGIAEVTPRGLMRTGKVPGEAAVTINYMGQVAAVRIQVPRPQGPDPYPSVPVHNEIDPLVWAKLRKMGFVPSGLADDATFLRRVYLDTLGTLPTPEEVRRFLADASAEKRSRWIDQVLERDEFADYWALKWSDILLVDRNTLGDRGAFEFHGWLRQQFALNRPYDEWVRELLTATGDSAKFGPVNFYRALRTPEEATRGVTQAFLGVRVECAQCHHHPFEKWAPSDFFGMAGFFNGIERKSLGENRELVFHAGYRETRIPLTNELAPTRPLDGETPAEIRDADPRIALANWLTDPENPWFARLAANRLWKHFLGRGIIEPEDDLRSTNPATNPELLDFLARQVVLSRYDLKSVMRLILNSRVYQLASEPNATNRDDSQSFSHYYVKRLPAEVLLDAISQVTGVPEAFPGSPPGTRAIALWDNRMPSYFLEIFGRPERNSPCECGRSDDPTMAQALHLMNAPEVEAKVSSSVGRVAQLIDRGATGSEIVDELCLAALGRRPTEREREVALDLFASAPPRQAAEDFLWTLLNCYEFLFVH